MNARGYSLIELLVVVAIIGIIAAVAYPSYQGYMRDTYRGQAVADLKQCSLALDRFYSNGFTYVGATIDDDGTEICYQWSPSDTDSTNARFELSFPGGTNPSRVGYTIRATEVDGDCVINLTQDGTQTTTNC